jgi:hypothetical protein
MDQLKPPVSHETIQQNDNSLDLEIESVAIRRMIEEVRAEQSGEVPRSYNRTFNRHNR